ncbi:DMT family transporter [Amorphus orientalis]|uniref:Drug/metabolite transporter (DMT)-like permease n=1 Tax=Amorphus orientalis TaxID=649198 RepID=A0AAE4AR44_9HYPH|nr:DMT family transporter [Amorphus orientalis]MDQ0313797.1 drug/metabolite transporter (DMT)-like permease [Amorphus orientalis]
MTATADARGAAAPAPAPDVTAVSLLVLLCASWGVQQVAIKLALVDIPPLIQMGIRYAGAFVLVLAWALMRGVSLFEKDGSLWPGLLSGGFFGVEFAMLYVALDYTTASRVSLFLYTAPFFVALGAILLLPGERLRPLQWLGLAFSFGGVALALGVPPPSADLSSLVADGACVVAGALWAGQTLTIRKSVLRTIRFEKVLLYQLGVAVIVASALALVRGESLTLPVSTSSVMLVLYQMVWVVSVTYLIWFSLLSRYAAGPLQAGTSMTPIFGVAAGVIVLGEPMTPGFFAAVALVFVGLVLVNYRPRAKPA